MNMHEETHNYSPDPNSIDFDEELADMVSVGRLQQWLALQAWFHVDA